VDTCRTCRGYVKTRAVLQPTPPYAVVLEDLSTVDWDLAALARVIGVQRRRVIPPSPPGRAAEARIPRMVRSPPLRPPLH